MLVDRTIDSLYSGVFSVLPVKSALSGKPKLPPSKWQLYFASFLRRTRELKPHEKMNVANIAREAGVAYKTISSEENEVRNHSLSVI